MSNDPIEKLFEIDGIDKFIDSHKEKLKNSYLYIVGSYAEISGNPDNSSVIHAAFWEVLKLNRNIVSFFVTAKDGAFFPDFPKQYNDNILARRIVSKILEMLKREYPTEII